MPLQKYLKGRFILLSIGALLLSYLAPYYSLRYRYAADKLLGSLFYTSLVLRGAISFIPQKLHKTKP